MRATHWWQTAVVYQIYVRSFADSDGDGIGDLEGVRQRLVELAALGVDAIWLTPCYPSPQKDHGYDVANYFDIEPAYGNLAIFDSLVADATAHRIKVMLDIVPNHCSFQHPWFQEALASAPDSTARSRFYFRDGLGVDHGEPPNNWRAWFGGSAWTRVDRQWYLHTFTPWQPDFDQTNPEVRQHFLDVLRFWFDRGVEGFRVDAVMPVGKAPGLPDAPPVPEGLRATDITLLNPYTTMRPEGHEVWRLWRAFIDQYGVEHPDRDLMTVAEAYTPKRPDLLASYARDDEFHQAFAFDLMLSPWHAGLLRQCVRDGLSSITSQGIAPAWALNNHDIQRIVTRLGRANARDINSYTGNNLISSDLAVDLDVGTRRARAMVALLLGLPGSAYLYQGEELGLPEVLDIPDHARVDPIFLRTDGAELGRDGCRIPLPWSASADGAYGFSPPGSTAAPWLPQPGDWGRYGAELQRDDPDSILSFYRRLLSIRRERFATADLNATVLDSSDDLVMIQRSDVLLVMNVGMSPGRATQAAHHRVVLSSCRIGEQVTADSIPPDTTVWFAR
jgi:alpha-glucosidase